MVSNEPAATRLPSGDMQTEVTPASTESGSSMDTIRYVWSASRTRRMRAGDATDRSCKDGRVRPCSRSLRFCHQNRRQSDGHPSKSRGSKFLADGRRRLCECASWRCPKSTHGIQLIDINLSGRRLTRICLSSAPVARNLPSGLKQTLRMYRSPVLLASSSINTL